MLRKQFNILVLPPRCDMAIKKLVSSLKQTPSKCDNRLNNSSEIKEECLEPGNVILKPCLETLHLNACQLKRRTTNTRQN